MRKMILALVYFISVYVVLCLPQLPPSQNGNTPIKNVDVFPNHDLKPVPFGHIFKDGIDDLDAGFKVPYDLLELDMRLPRTREEEYRLLQKTPKEKIVKINYDEELNTPMRTKNVDMEGIIKIENDNVTSIDDNPKWFNFGDIQRRNIMNPRSKSSINTRATPDSVAVKPKNLFNNRNTKSRFFSRHTFDMLPDTGEGRINWTTCDEFVRGIGPKQMMHPKDIVNIDWEPFYIWAERKRIFAIIHRFSYPTKKVVKEYKEAYGRYLNKSIDWEQPKLILKEEIEMLLIAGDRKGLFHAIPRHSIPLSVRHKNISLPVMDIRLKIEDPYLAMMYCNDFYATIMASPGNVPESSKEKVEEASVLKFKGEGYSVRRNKYLESLKKGTPKSIDIAVDKQKELSFIRGVDY